MNCYKPIILCFVVICCQACFLDSDSYEECHPSPSYALCSDYNETLSKCHSEEGSGMYLPGCSVVEYCTDYPADTDTDSDTVDTDLDTASDSDTVPQGRVCEQFCEGELVPCDELSEAQCRSASHCEWYADNSSTL
ncbi:MAG: hypothetical protein JXX29_10455 [Deltaproteobacteria bacterium]|nr:hypothetical protein [Deltaproteobacteria bacterium]MBN2672088.1 hypothetical protein [Deltaproteobacteria bacterium]